MPGHEVADHGEHVFAHFGMGGRQRVMERVAEGGMRGDVRVLLPEPAVMEADRPRHVVEPVRGGSLGEEGDRAPVGGDERVHPRLDAAVFRQVGLEVERAVLGIGKLAPRIVGQDELARVVRGREVDRGEPCFGDAANRAVVALIIEVPGVGIESGLHCNNGSTCFICLRTGGPPRPMLAH
jgi:hypothetical protein